MSNTINLLAPSTLVKTRIKSDTPNHLLIVGCIFALITAAASYGALFALNLKVERELAHVESEINKLAPVAQRETDYTSLKTELAQTIDQVDKLNKSKPMISAYLDELAKRIPATVSLTNLYVAHEPFEANLRGTCLSQVEVAQFGKELQKSNMFKNSVISASEKRSDAKNYSFSITVTPKEQGGNK